MPLYDFGVIIDPEIPPEEETATLERLEGIITDGGGEVAEKDTWGRRQLAYPIDKKNYGVYHFWKVNVGGEVLEDGGEVDRCSGSDAAAVLAKVPLDAANRHDEPGALAAEVHAEGLGDCLGAVGDGVLGELSGENQPHGRLDLTRGERLGRALLQQVLGLDRDPSLPVTEHGADDMHRLLGDGLVRVDHLEDPANVGGVRLVPGHLIWSPPKKLPTEMAGRILRDAGQMRYLTKDLLPSR